MTGFVLDAPPGVKPRLEHLPSFHHTSAEEVMDFLDLVGMPLMPWQAYSLAATLGEKADGRWAAPTVVDLCPRQNGKSYKWAARVLAGLFVLNEQLITYTAHKVDTAVEVFRLVEQYATANPSTRKLISHIIHSQGKESIELYTGQRFKIVSRVRASGRGYSGDCLILDEALELRDQGPINALLPTLSARPNPQVIFTSSAGDPGSVVLAHLRETAKKGADDLAYLEYSAPEDADLDDETYWHMANPAMPQLILPETLRRHRQWMSDDGFRQEHLGIWSAQVSGTVIPPAAWEATTYASTDEPIPGLLGLAFDVAPDRAWSSVVAAYTTGSHVHVRLSRHRLGDGWLFDDLVQLSQAHQVPLTYDDAGPARDVAERLRLAGVPLQPLSGRDYATSCQRLLSGVVNGTITHHPDLALDEAAQAATTRRMGEAWAFARRPTISSTPISPLTAAALAVWANDHLNDHTPVPRPEVF